MARFMNPEPGSPVPEIRFNSPQGGSPESLHQARHDIRTAMHVVTGMAEVLSMSGSLTAREKEIVATLRRNAERALALMDGLFDALEPAKAPDTPPPERRYAYPGVEGGGGARRKQSRAFW